MSQSKVNAKLYKSKKVDLSVVDRIKESLGHASGILEEAKKSVETVRSEYGFMSDLKEEAWLYKEKLYEEIETLDLIGEDLGFNLNDLPEYEEAKKQMEDYKEVENYINENINKVEY